VNYGQLSLLCLRIIFERVLRVTGASLVFFWFCCVFFCISAGDWLERLVFENICNVLMGTLNPTHSLTRSFEIHIKNRIKIYSRQKLAF